MHPSRISSEGKGSSSCSCLHDHLDPDEMCDKCRDKHFQNVVAHAEFLHDESFEERLIAHLDGLYQYA